MFSRIILIMIGICSFVLWSSWQRRKRLLQRIRSTWGKPIKRERDMEAISDFFRSRDDTSGALDDRTWNDLLLDDLFKHLDRTESTVGRQLLYHRLRSAPYRLDEFEAAGQLPAARLPQGPQPEAVVVMVRRPEVVEAVVGEVMAEEAAAVAALPRRLRYIARSNNESARRELSCCRALNRYCRGTGVAMLFQMVDVISLQLPIGVAFCFWASAIRRTSNG